MTKKSVHLREMAQEDLELLYNWENRLDWQLLSDVIPEMYSKKDLSEFIKKGTQLDRDGQMRWMICNLVNNRVLGTMDLFDFDKEARSAKVGILIAGEVDRQKGYALEALQILKQKMIDTSKVRELFAETMIENASANILFTKAGFDLVESNNSSINVYRMQI